MAITSNYWKEPRAITAIERSVCSGRRGKSSFNVASMWLKSFRNLNLSHDKSLEGNDICCFYVINLNKYGRIDTARRISQTYFTDPNSWYIAVVRAKPCHCLRLFSNVPGLWQSLCQPNIKNSEWKCFLPSIIIAWPRCLKHYFDSPQMKLTPCWRVNTLIITGLHVYCFLLILSEMKRQ